MKLLKREAAMETEFGVLEVLKIAERLEHNGRQFYTKMVKAGLQRFLSVNSFTVPLNC